MADGKLKIDIRRGKIMERLQRDGKVLVTDLSRELGVTAVTLRNDLNAMERDGYLERVQGGAILKLRPTRERMTQEHEDKRAVAREAAKLVENGTTLFVNSGTTTRYLAEALTEHKNLNIVTNSMAVAMELGRVPSIHVLLLGGEVNAQYAFTYGEDAKRQLSRYQADWAILSVDGVSAQGGITTFHVEEATVNRAMMERAKKIMIVADHTKIGRAGFAHLWELGEGVSLVTDGKCGLQVLDELTESGVEIYVAKA